MLWIIKINETLFSRYLMGKYNWVYVTNTLLITVSLSSLPYLPGSYILDIRYLETDITFNSTDQISK